MKSDTHVRVFSQTLAHGNSKMKKGTETEKADTKKNTVKMERSYRK